MQEILTSLPLFGALSETERAALAAAFEPVALQPGDLLFREGDPGDALYVVETGSVQVFVPQAKGDAQVLATLGPGQFVGEMALLYRRPRAATVRAATACTLLSLSAASLDRLAADDPAILRCVLDTAGQRLPSLTLASVPLFAGVGAAALKELDLEANWVRLAAGEPLFREGDAADAMYVVVWGRLAATDDAHPEQVTFMGRGEVVGEVGVFTGSPRAKTVRAARDSELVRFARPDVERWLIAHPQASVEMVRQLAARFQRGPIARREAPASIVAVLSATGAPLAAEWLRPLFDALREAGGSALHVDGPCLESIFGSPLPSPARGSVEQARAQGWLHEQENHSGFTVFDCDAMPPEWRDFSLQQADLVLLVAAPGAQVPAGPGPGWLTTKGQPVAADTPRELVLLHAATTTQPRGTAAWLDRFPVRRHHHVRVDRRDDYGRVARYAAGTATGLAMSGGGARTFAHVGVVQALAERAIPIDAVGGVSAGSLVAAYTALGHDATSLRHVLCENMKKYSLASDATLPITSFLSGLKLIPAMQRVFGEIRIEDLWVPFFCLSSNLTTAQLMVHDRGLLWIALRASTSVPGVHPPVAVNGELLVDGGVLNNIPIDVMRERCPGRVIASDVSLVDELRTDIPDQQAASGWKLLAARLGPGARRRPAMPHVFEILTRTAVLGSIRHGESVCDTADVYVRTPTAGVPTFDWDAGATLIDPARKLALDALARAGLGATATS